MSKFLTRFEVIKQGQRIALYIFFFSINFDEIFDPFNTNGFFSVSKLTGLVYLITIMPDIKYINKSDAKNPFLLSILFFFALLTVVSLLNINSISSDFFDFTIFQNIFLFWLLINNERKDHFVLEKGMLSFALGSIILALLFCTGIGIEYEDGRVGIFGDNPNVISLRMCISLVILILAIVQNRLKLGRLRYLLILPIPIMFQLMIETASRVGIISFSLVLIIGVVLFKTKNVFSKIAVFAGGGIVIIFLFKYIMKSEIVVRRLLSSYEQVDLAGRDVIWQRLLPLFENNPIIGVGKTGYAYFTQINFGFQVSPHNVILEVLFYTGIVGLLIYLYFLYRILKGGYQYYKAAGYLLPLLLLVPVMGMLISGQILYTKIGWIIYAYIVGCSTVISKQETVVNS